MLRKRRTMKYIAVVLIGLTSAALADEKTDNAPVNFNDHIKPIFRQHCAKCHGDDQQKAGLNLQSFEGAIKGGSGGKAVVAGRASASLLYQAITNEDAEARMPPNQPPLPEAQVKLILAWITDGLRESATSKSLVVNRDLTFTPTASAMTKPDGPPPMPEKLPSVSLPELKHKLPIIAMDASPWAPLIAVAGQEHVRLIDIGTHKELGVLPFPEGVPHVIHFSRDGAVLLVAGGKPVQSGKAVLFDVRSGRRLAEIGDELDAVLAADLSDRLQSRRQQAGHGRSLGRPASVGTKDRWHPADAGRAQGVDSVSALAQRQPRVGISGRRRPASLVGCRRWLASDFKAQRSSAEARRGRLWPAPKRRPRGIL